jgi:hypothetical protein
MPIGGYGDGGRFWDQSVIPNVKNLKPVNKHVARYCVAYNAYFDACARLDVKAQHKAEDTLREIEGQIDAWPKPTFAVGLLAGIAVSLVLFGVSSLAGVI